MSDQHQKADGWWHQQEGVFWRIFFLLAIAALTGARKYYGENWWPHLAAWLALAVAPNAVLWLLWRLFRPFATFVQQEGIHLLSHLKRRPTVQPQDPQSLSRRVRRKI